MKLRMRVNEMRTIDFRSKDEKLSYKFWILPKITRRIVARSRPKVEMAVAALQNSLASQISKDIIIGLFIFLWRRGLISLKVRC